MTLTTKSYEALARLLEAEPEPGDEKLYRPRYNVAPTDPHWIARSGERGRGRRKSPHAETTRLLSPARWGIRKDGGPIAINVRSETVARGAFRSAFKDRRCLVPADGFFEWTGPKSARQPIWFHDPSGDLLLFAGLFEEAAPGTLLFTILTAPANDTIAPVHDRMPLMLSRGRARDWLAMPSRELLVPETGLALVGTPVSPRVNSVKNDDPACLLPGDGSAKPPDTKMKRGQKGQLGLF